MDAVCDDWTIGCFGDKRLAAAGRLFFKRIVDTGSALVSKIARNRAEQVKFERFLWNDAVSLEELKATEFSKTSLVTKEVKHILAIQDTTEINLDRIRGKVNGLGVVGNNQNIGLFLHPVLAVDPSDNFVYGLADLKVWSRDLERKNEELNNKKDMLPLERKESYRWVQCANEAITTLSSGGKTITIVGDRESDFYEELYRVPCDGVHLLIRSKVNRTIEVEMEPNRRTDMASFIEQLPISSQKVILLPRNGGVRRAKSIIDEKKIADKAYRTHEREATLDLRFSKVNVIKPQGICALDAPEAVKITIIDVQEVMASGLTSNDRLIHWRLLTTHEITTIAQAWEIVEWYKKRWFIEQFFRTVKTAGMDTESLELEKASAIEKMVFLMMLASTRILQLTLCREGKIDRPASLIFSDKEIEVLAYIEKDYEGKTEKQKNPHKKKTVAWAHWVLARLGGWKGYLCAGPAGPSTIMDGIFQFHQICRGFMLASRLQS